MAFSFDLSTLKLPIGTYSITVKAKKEGYRDSAESNAVSYSVVPKTQEEINYIYYTLSEDSKYYTCSGVRIISQYINPNIEIPAYINGLPVKYIADGVFEKQEELTSIVLPDTIEGIGSSAFLLCENLTHINIPKSVRTIGSYAFCYCTSWQTEEIDLTNVTVVGNNAFDNCEKIESVILPKISTIPTYAFADSGLKSVKIPSTVITIGEHAFARCYSLEKIWLPSGLKKVSGWAFASCTSLTDVYFGGTEAQWNDLTIGRDNEPLQNANIFYENTLNFIIDNKAYIGTPNMSWGEWVSSVYNTD